MTNHEVFNIEVDYDNRIVFENHKKIMLWRDDVLLGPVIRYEGPEEKLDFKLSDLIKKEKERL